MGRSTIRSLTPATAPTGGAAPGVSVVGLSVRGMLIDCGGCVVRGEACADCVVTFLTIPVRAATGSEGTAPAVDLDAAERTALTVLASSGLVPPLRMRPAI